MFFLKRFFDNNSKTHEYKNYIEPIKSDSPGLKVLL